MTDYCKRCLRPEKRCLCGFVNTIENELLIVILQHHRERFHPKGTATLASLCLSNCQLFSGKSFHSTLKDLKQDYELALLWPNTNEESAIINNTSNLEHSKNKPKALIVIDGTWRKAAKIYHSHPELHLLPHLDISHKVNQYHHRKSPSEHHLSTLEAIYCGLQILDKEGADNYDDLLSAQQAMITHWQVTAAKHNSSENN